MLNARSRLVEDFGGEQLCLGRAFYTHLETGAARRYFQDAAASDALVEATVPGLQQDVLALLARMTGGVVRRRHGFCGPGVHVFPAGEKVARAGGVVHFDVEGVAAHDLDRRARALSLVIALQPPRSRGGLKLWDARYRGSEAPTARQLARPATTTLYRAGDALLFSSFSLHQIRPFPGDLDRVSATLHAVEVDDGVWDAWF